LSASPTVPDLSLRSSTHNTPQPLADLALVDAAVPLLPERVFSATPNLGPVRAAASTAPTPELPLFGSAIADDVPLITRASPPRTPLAVRRATPEVPRLRGADVRTASLDLVLPEVEVRPTLGRRTVAHAQEIQPAPTHAAEPAGVFPRVLAALVDVVVLAGIDVVVVYFTMQISGVTLDELSILPKVPLLAFILVQNVGYFVAFTAGGQTLGQMLFGIKVVSDDAGRSPDLAHAALRTVVWTALTVPAGLGLVPALFSSDHRGLHDRCAGTRVVRANA
jgi:uncharacterized RDD family membrane protein YckC